MQHLDFQRAADLHLDVLGAARAHIEVYGSVMEQHGLAASTIELSSVAQPRLDDPRRRTALDRGRHEHVRIDDDEHGCRTDQLVVRRRRTARTSSTARSTAASSPSVLLASTFDDNTARVSAVKLSQADWRVTPRRCRSVARTHRRPVRRRPACDESGSRNCPLAANRSVVEMNALHARHPGLRRRGPGLGQPDARRAHRPTGARVEATRRLRWRPGTLRRSRRSRGVRSA